MSPQETSARQVSTEGAAHPLHMGPVRCPWPLVSPWLLFLVSPLLSEVHFPCGPFRFLTRIAYVAPGFLMPYVNSCPSNEVGVQDSLEN